ncbi:MAG TPA: 50S ribosomal protein L6 [Candidatus Saccharimonadales bacterium]|nr:50S ribosomal protein L6 [Candidatus Saccharimonadales bacterium]
MSKIGKVPVKYESDVTLKEERGSIEVVGPKGTLKFHLPSEVSLEIAGGTVSVKRINDSDRAKAMHGMSRTLIANMVEGVTKGYEKTLELSGVGFRSSVAGNKLVLNVGYSHPVEMEAPEGIAFKVAENKITVSGFDKALVGEIASNIRKVRPAEPYKGKGIKYENEVIRRKAGKAGKVGTGAG